MSHQEPRGLGPNLGPTGEGRASARDLYKLRRSHLEAEHQAIMAQLAQNRFKIILLGLELKYNLLASEAALDINTGEIRRLKEEANEPGGHEEPGAPGPEGRGSSQLSMD